MESDKRRFTTPLKAYPTGKKCTVTKEERAQARKELEEWNVRLKARTEHTKK